MMIIMHIFCKYEITETLVRTNIMIGFVGVPPQVIVEKCTICNNKKYSGLPLGIPKNLEKDMIHEYETEGIIRRSQIRNKIKEN